MDGSEALIYFTPKYRHEFISLKNEKFAIKINTSLTKDLSLKKDESGFHIFHISNVGIERRRQ